MAVKDSERVMSGWAALDALRKAPYAKDYDFYLDADEHPPEPEDWL